MTSEAVKSFKDLGTLKSPVTEGATRFIGTQIRKQLSGYGRGVYEDIGVLLGTTGSAVSRWANDYNGATYEYVLKLEMLFGVPVHAWSNSGTYDRPQKWSKMDEWDPRGYAEYVLQTSSRLKSKELMADVVRNIRQWLMTNKPKNAPGGPTMSRDARPAAPKPTITARDRTFATDVMASGDRDAISFALSQAETFRRKHNLEWYIKDDGSLGARRTTVENF